MSPIQIATTDAQIMSCWPALHYLRPKLVLDTFLAQIRAMQQEGYELVFIQSDQQVVAVAGFRYLHRLNAGRVLYLDDLVTLPTAQCRGYAGQLLGYLDALVRERQLDGVALDSGLKNYIAHSLYTRYGFEKVAFHFLKQA